MAEKSGDSSARESTIATTTVANDGSGLRNRAPSTDAATTSPAKNSGSIKTTQAAPGPSRLAGAGQKVKAGSDLIRGRIASVVWLVAVLAAVTLGLGALLIALDANQTNVLVDGVLDTANKIDGPFWRVFSFYEENDTGVRTGSDDAKNHLVNWGLAAVSYLIGGQLIARIIRP